MQVRAALTLGVIFEMCKNINTFTLTNIISQIAIAAIELLLPLLTNLKLCFLSFIRTVLSFKSLTPNN
jgi:hypothetical protein